MSHTRSTRHPHKRLRSRRRVACFVVCGVCGSPLVGRCYPHVLYDVLCRACRDELEVRSVAADAERVLSWT
jgi:hypothetical protein